MSNILMIRKTTPYLYLKKKTNKNKVNNYKMSRNEVKILNNNTKNYIGQT